ncbi:MAG: phosphoribosylglycinamide formyltransferase [Verrucomicrobia bacterium]|nr:phosphoribosylglycinamide formyltransferase [Verrucomicrobiota bacterium]
MNPLTIGVLGSGKGSNCGAILEAIADGRLAETRVGAVISDVPDAGILALARQHKVPARHLPPGKFKTKLEPHCEEQLVALLQKHGVELVVLAGYMRLLKEPMLAAFPRRILNIHPSLLPKYPGLQAWKQALDAGERQAGCTVHLVDGGMDTGEILAQATVPVLAHDTPETLHARIQAAEHELYPQVVGWFASGRVR